MKYALIAIALSLSACASAPSEYSQGCRDGVTDLVSDFNEGGLKMTVDQKVLGAHCDELDRAREQKHQSERPGGGRWN